MFNTYMFSYVLINPNAGKTEHVLGTKESTDHYEAEASLRDLIEKKFPARKGWKTLSFLVNEEPVRFLSEIL